MKYLILCLFLTGCFPNRIGTIYPTYFYGEKVHINNGFYKECIGYVVRDDGDNNYEIGLNHISCYPRYSPENTIFIYKSYISLIK